MTLNRDGRKETVILSLVAGFMGEEVSLKPWGESDVKKYERRAGAGLEASCATPLVATAWLAVPTNGCRTSTFSSKPVLEPACPGFESDELTLPTLIYFSAYRNIIRMPAEIRGNRRPRAPNYRPVHIFDVEGREWRDSLDNLLVWLKWMDDGRFEVAIAAINERVFKVGDKRLFSGKKLRGVRKEPPEAIIEANGMEHRLDRLSSGEKSLVQLYLRLGAHMTRNTILLIDEPEVHLHRNWQYETLFTLLNIAKSHFPNVSVFMATHSERMMKAFGLNSVEENLRKGAYIIETAEEEDRAEEIAKEATAKALSRGMSPTAGGK